MKAGGPETDVVLGAVSWPPSQEQNKWNTHHPEVQVGILTWYQWPYNLRLALLEEKKAAHEGVSSVGRSSTE